MSSRLGYPFDHMPIWDAAKSIQISHVNSDVVPATQTRQVETADPNRFYLHLDASDAGVPSIFTPAMIAGGRQNDPKYFTDANGVLLLTWWEHGPLVQQAWNWTNPTANPVAVCVTRQVVIEWPTGVALKRTEIKVPKCPSLIAVPTP
jgi:hypothetical protein